QPDQAVAAARRLGERFPDELDPLLFHANHHIGRDEGVPALEAVGRARALRPLDESATNLEWMAHIVLARQLAIQGRWDEGRAEFAAAERVSPESSRRYTLLARKAVFELKAGQAGLAEKYIAAALEPLVEPTPLWLALLIEGIRYRLPKAGLDRFESRWINALTKRVRSETAGELADLLAAFLASDRDYPGRAEHVKQVADYLRRTTRIKYGLEDLVHVCAFLQLVPKEQDLLDKLARRGLKLFPEAPAMLMLAGSLEMQKGPFGGGNLTLARAHFQKALERAKASSDPRDAKLIPKLQEGLSGIADLFSHTMGLPFGGFGGFGGGLDAMYEAMGRFMHGEFDDDYDDFDDDFDDDDDFDEELPPRPARAPAPRPAKKGRKRKKKK
ncbi:MAG: hypothetical protein QOE66_1957, partial [Chloroflexota bacterium]|nr:hypothetical protein [Chloroflexota bacterium]